MKSSGLSVSNSVLLGSLMISLAILISSGTINLKDGRVSLSGNNTTAQAPATSPAPQQKTEKDIVPLIKSFAARIGLDQEKFNNCLDTGQQAQAVQADETAGTQVGVNGTPTFYINGRVIPGAAPYAQFKSIIDEELGTASPSGQITRVTVDTGNLPPVGNTDAPVKIVEFSDYQCPFCEQFFTQTESQLLKDYVDTGKVVFYYRDFPLTQIHPGAEKGAEAARCAGDQGKYWQMHDQLFSNQNAIFY